MDEDVEQFMAVTGTNEQVARGYLEISSGDPMQAIQLFFENPELQASFTAPAAAASGPAAPSRSSRPAPATSSSRTRTTGREDAHGVIHIDSDDEPDIPMTEDDEDDEDVHAVARTAQEEEDAAMARRLQEEMYGENPGSTDADGVRAPIARRTETLAAPDMPWSIDDDRNAAILEQMRLRRTGLSQGKREMHLSEIPLDFHPRLTEPRRSPKSIQPVRVG